MIPRGSGGCDMSNFGDAFDGSLDSVYYERNLLVSALSKVYPSWITWDMDAEEGWEHVITIEGPTGQMSWHIPEDFITSEGLPVVHMCYGTHIEYDGHSTDEKYRRLLDLPDQIDRTGCED
jgi:hypothetical protein